MTSRTAGYFHVSPKSDEESFFEDVNILRHDGLAVAVAVHNGDITPEEAMGNALMFAAAPEMLEALKLLQEKVLSRGEWDDGCFYHNGTSASELQDPLRLAAAAVFKAEGRS